MYEVPLNVLVGQIASICPQQLAWLFIYPEILLSLMVLSLVIYGVNPLSTFKIAVIILMVIGTWVSVVGFGDLGEDSYFNIAQSFGGPLGTWADTVTPASNGLLMIDG